MAMKLSLGIGYEQVIMIIVRISGSFIREVISWLLDQKLLNVSPYLVGYWGTNVNFSG